MEGQERNRAYGTRIDSLSIRLLCLYGSIVIGACLTAPQVQAEPPAPQTCLPSFVPPKYLNPDAYQLIASGENTAQFLSLNGSRESKNPRLPGVTQYNGFVAVGYPQDGGGRGAHLISGQFTKLGDKIIQERFQLGNPSTEFLKLHVLMDPDIPGSIDRPLFWYDDPTKPLLEADGKPVLNKGKLVYNKRVFINGELYDSLPETHPIRQLSKLPDRSNFSFRYSSVEAELKQIGVRGQARSGFLTGIALPFLRDLGVPLDSKVAVGGIVAVSAFENHLNKVKGGNRSLGGGLLGGFGAAMLAEAAGGCQQQQEAAAVFGSFGGGFAGGSHAGVASGVCQVGALAGELTYTVGKGDGQYGGEYWENLSKTGYWRSASKCYFGR